MKKAVNKIIKLFSLGLLLFAAQSSYAQSPQQVMYQDAWQFMEKHAADGGAEFKSTYGPEAGKVVDIVTCGTKKCNLNFKTCMSRKSGKYTTDYLCVKKDEADNYKKHGYSESSGGSGSLRNSLKNLSTLGKDCYKAKELGSNQQAKYYCAKITGETVEIRAAKEEGGLSCETVEVAWYNSRSCIFCPLIGVVYAVADKVTVTAQQAFARSFAIVIAVGLAVWLAFKTLTFVSSLSKQDAAKYLTELLIQSFKFLMTFFALMYYEEIFNMIIRPLIRAGMNFGTTFVLVEDVYTRFGSDVFNALVKAGATGDGTSLVALGDKVPSDYIRNANNRFYDVYTYATIENMAHNVNLQYSLLQTIGSSLTCIGFRLLFHLFENENGNWGFGLGWACIIYGICFGLFGFLLMMAFVFYLIDVVVQLGIVGAILPFLVASWPFKITSGYTRKGFDLLLNSIFTFMLMGLVVNLSIELIRAAVEYNSDSGTIGVAENGLSALIKAISEIDAKKLNKLVNVISIGFILFIMANIMAMMLLKKVQEFTSTFVSGGMPAISSNFARRAATTATGAVKKAASPVVKGFTKGVKDETEEVRENIRRGAQNMVKKATKNAANVASKGLRSFGKGVGLGGLIAMGDSRAQKIATAKEQRLAKNAQEEKQKENNNSKLISDILGQGNSDAGN